MKIEVEYKVTREQMIDMKNGLEVLKNEMRDLHTMIRKMEDDIDQILDPKPYCETKWGREARRDENYV